MSRLGAFAIEIIGLQSARGRLVFFCTATAIILVVPYSALSDLSLWQRLGLDWAPSIGLTRAYWLLIHLDPVAAWQRNPLIYAVLAVGTPLIVKDMLSILKDKRRAISSSEASARQPAR